MLFIVMPWQTKLTVKRCDTDILQQEYIQTKMNQIEISCVTNMKVINASCCTFRTKSNIFYRIFTRHTKWMWDITLKIHFSAMFVFKMCHTQNIEKERKEIKEFLIYFCLHSTFFFFLFLCLFVMVSIPWHTNLRNF